MSHYALIFLLTKTKKLPASGSQFMHTAETFSKHSISFEHNLKIGSQRRYKIRHSPSFIPSNSDHLTLYHHSADLAQATPTVQSLPLGTPTRMSSSNQPSQAPTPNQTTSPQDDEQIGLSSFGEPPHDRDLTAINSVDSEIVRLLSTNKQTNSVLAGLTGGAKRVFEWFKGFISKVSWNGIKEGCNEIIGRFNWEDILNWFKGISSKIDWHDILEWFKKKRKARLQCISEEGVNLTIYDN